MTRYDILCGRAALKPALFTRAVRAVVTDFSPPNKPLQLSVDSLPVAFVEFHPPVVVGHVHMNKYLGAEIAVEKVPNLPTKGMPQIFWDNLWFQEDEEGLLRGPEYGNIAGKKGWLYHESWLRFLD